MVMRVRIVVKPLLGRTLWQDTLEFTRKEMNINVMFVKVSFYKRIILLHKKRISIHQLDKWRSPYMWCMWVTNVTQIKLWVIIIEHIQRSMFAMCVKQRKNQQGKAPFKECNPYNVYILKQRDGSRYPYPNK